MTQVYDSYGLVEPLKFGPPSKDSVRTSVLGGAKMTSTSVTPATTSSSYWRVPDKTEYMTGIAAHETDPLVAVSSGAGDANLFIYELQTDASDGRAVLTHHQTISLGEIHSLQWVSPSTPLGAQGNVLVSGHNQGLVHLTLLPDPYSSNVPAEILKRFNHNRHVERPMSTRIRHLGLSGGAWTCCPQSSIMSLFSEHLFLWDPSRSDVPLAMRRSRGTLCFDMCSLRDGIVSTGGRRGVSIKDMRVKNGGGLAPPTENDGNVTTVRWSPHDENLVAAVHSMNTVKVWDIRATKPLRTLEGHTDMVNDVCWSLHDRNELQSASCDGTIRMWDLSSEPGAPSAGTSTASTTSLRGQQHTGSDWNSSKSWKLYRQRLSRHDEDMMSLEYYVDNASDREACTTVFSQNKQFLRLASFATSLSPRDAVLSVDTDGFFGLHTVQGGAPRRASRCESPDSSSASSSSDRDYSPPASP